VTSLTSLLHDNETLLTSLDLSNNTLEDFTLELIENITYNELTSVNLEENNLTSLYIGQFEQLMPNLTWLGLSGNPFHCDLKLCDLQEMLLNSTVNVSEPVCASPLRLTGINLSSAEIGCNFGPGEPANKILLTAIIISGSILIALSMVAFGLVYLHHNGRVLFIRRQQTKAEDYAYDGPGLDTFHMEELTEETVHF
jgi:hypothetical protein